MKTHAAPVDRKKRFRDPKNFRYMTRNRMFKELTIVHNFIKGVSKGLREIHSAVDYNSKSVSDDELQFLIEFLPEIRKELVTLSDLMKVKDKMHGEVDPDMVGLVPEVKEQEEPAGDTEQEESISVGPEDTGWFAPAPDAPERVPVYKPESRFTFIVKYRSIDKGFGSVKKISVTAPTRGEASGKIIEKFRQRDLEIIDMRLINIQKIETPESKIKDMPVNVKYRYTFMVKYSKPDKGGQVTERRSVEATSQEEAKTRVANALNSEGAIVHDIYLVSRTRSK